jgi:hypothetical protein
VRRRVALRIRAAAGNATIAEAKVAITDNYVAGEDVLTVPTHRLIASGFDPATGVLTLSGTATIAQYQWALRAVRYSNRSQNPSTDLRVVSFQICDGVPWNGWSNVVTRSIQVRAVNTTPVLTLPPTMPTTVRNISVAINGIAVADVDSNGGLARLTLRVTRGTIEFVNLGTATISEGANNSGMIAIVGTLAELNAVLVPDNLIYRPPTDYAGTAVLHLTLNDLGNTGSGRPRERHRAVRVRVV